MRAIYFCAVASLMLVGCGPKLTNPTIVKTQDKAGSVSIAVSSPEPWAPVSRALAPNFTMTGDLALQQVLPISQRIQEQVLRAFAAQLGIGLPQSFSSSSATSTDTISGSQVITPTSEQQSSTVTSSESDTSTSTTQPGVVPAVPSGVPASARLPGAPNVAGDVGVSPILKYQAAMALFQSVQLMNREVLQASSLRCHVPYLAKLKVTVDGYRDNLPYDIYTRIGFFPNNEFQGSGPTPLVTKTSADACDNNSVLPQVIPIIATDDLERALFSRSVDVATQVGLAASFMYSGVGGSASANNLSQTLKAISGQTMTSRFTVGRQSDNSIFVKIGASNQAVAGSAVTTQNYDVATLLLIPKAYFKEANSFTKQIRLVSYTRMIDSNTGEILATRPVENLALQTSDVLRQTLTLSDDAALLKQWDALPEQQQADFIRVLLSEIQESDYPGFVDVIKNTSASGGFSLATLIERPSHIDAFWTAAGSLLPDTTFKSAYFEVAGPSPLAIPSQTALLADDGKASTSVRLFNVSGNSLDGLAASMEVAESGKPSATLAALSQVLNTNQRSLALTFPSLASLGFTKDATAKVIFSQFACPTTFLCPQLLADSSYSTIKQAAPKTPSPFTIRRKSNNIVMKDGLGSFSFAMELQKGDPKEVNLSVSNVEVVSAQIGQSTLEEKDGQFVVKSNGVVSFQLRNLVDGQLVELVATSGEASETLRFVVTSSGSNE